MPCTCLSLVGPGYSQGGQNDLSAMAGGVPRQGVAPRPDEVFCQTPGCPSAPEYRGYCHRCYDRLQNQSGGASGYSPRNPGAPMQEKKICKTPGCGEHPKINGYCYDCYANIQRTTGGGEFPTDGNRCKEPTCGRRPTPLRLGYCEQCYEARYLVAGQDDWR